VLTPGERHEVTAFEQLMQQGSVKRPGRGRPRLRPRRLVADKGYSFARVRQYLRRRGMAHTIPTRRNEKFRSRAFDRELYRQRNRVERLFNRLKQNRRVATRYEKRAHNYLAILHIASLRLWI
jgi:transposase